MSSPRTAPTSWRETILALTDPLAQRFTFARYVLGEDNITAASIAGRFAPLGLMDAREYDHLEARWSA